MVNLLRSWCAKVVRWFRRTPVSRIGNDVPFYVATRQDVQVSDGDQIPAKMQCPMCQTYWADVVVVLGGPLVAENFTVKELYQKSVKIKPGDPLTCPACGYEYTQWAMMALVLSAMNKLDLVQKSVVEMGRGTTKSSDIIV